MKNKLKSILVCPICKGALLHKPRKNVFICEQDQLIYEIRSGIPVLLKADAKTLNK